MNKTAMIVVLLAGLAGCTVLPPATPVSQYRLPPAASGAGEQNEQLTGLRLARPQATGVHQGNRLLVLTQTQSYQAYGDARWEAPLPELWQDWLLDALWRDGRFAALSREENGMQAEWELAGTLRALEVDLSDGRQQVVIRFDAQLLRTQDRRILASRRFEQRVAVNSLNADAVVSALGQAGSELAAGLSDWLVNRSSAG